MKRVKAINGYSIYEATLKDEEKYNVVCGCFYIYFSSDIRDFGLSNSDWDWESGSIEEATEWATGSNYAIAKEIVEETTTAASFEEIEEVEAMLNSGLSVEEIKEEKEGKTMNYNYRTEIKEDVLQYIKDNVDLTDYETIEELEERLNEDLWTEDSVTGNGSGSYTFNRYKAEEYLMHNLDLLAEALEEFGSSMDVLKNGAEACDVTIRCYLLGQCIIDALEEIEDEWNEAHPEE